MRRLTAFALAAGLLTAATSDAAVFCAKRRDGGFNGSVKIREACKRGETQLTPSEVGFCCSEASTTSTSTTTGTCPTYTSTTLGIPDCGGGGGACFGLCANARACVPDAQTQACGCTGAPLPCGVVTYYGTCGGTCPAGEACTLYAPPLPNGCLDVPRCACVLE
jgi:hypothetical protein